MHRLQHLRYGGQHQRSDEVYPEPDHGRGMAARLAPRDHPRNDKAGPLWGGRVTAESALPGLAAWARVRDWRLWQVQQAANAQLYLESPLTASDILGFGIPHVALATGSTWRADGVGRAHRRPLGFLDPARVLTPNDIMAKGAGAVGNDGPVVVFDDDRFYIASLLAEVLVDAEHEVVFVTPAPVVSPWSENTLEQARIQRRLMEKKVKIVPLHDLADMAPDRLTLSCVYSGELREIGCGTLVSVTARLPNDQLWSDLVARQDQWADAGIRTVKRIGDCHAPSLIAMAVQSGHAYARHAELETEPQPLREDFGHI